MKIYIQTLVLSLLTSRCQMREIDRDSHLSFQKSVHIIIIQTHWKKYPSVCLPKRKTPECKPNAFRHQLFLSTLNSTSIFRIESCPPQMLNSKWSNKSPNFRCIMDSLWRVRRISEIILCFESAKGIDKRSHESKRRKKKRTQVKRWGEWGGET